MFCIWLSSWRFLSLSLLFMTWTRSKSGAGSSRGHPVFPCAGTRAVGLVRRLHTGPCFCFLHHVSAENSPGGNGCPGTSPRLLSYLRLSRWPGTQPSPFWCCSGMGRELFWAWPASSLRAKCAQRLRPRGQRWCEPPPVQPSPWLDMCLSVSTLSVHVHGACAE